MNAQWDGKDKRGESPGRRETDCTTCLFHSDTLEEIAMLKAESRKKVTNTTLGIVLSVLMGCLTIVTGANVYFQQGSSEKIDNVIVQIASLSNVVEDSQAMMKRRMRIFEVYQVKVLKKLKIEPPEYDVYYDDDDRSKSIK